MWRTVPSTTEHPGLAHSPAASSPLPPMLGGVLGAKRRVSLTCSLSESPDGPSALCGTITWAQATQPGADTLLLPFPFFPKTQVSEKFRLFWTWTAWNVDGAGPASLRSHLLVYSPRLHALRTHSPCFLLSDLSWGQGTQDLGSQPLFPFWSHLFASPCGSWRLLSPQFCLSVFPLDWLLASAELPSGLSLPQGDPSV